MSNLLNLVMRKYMKLLATNFTVSRDPVLVNDVSGVDDAISPRGNSCALFVHHVGFELTDNLL